MYPLFDLQLMLLKKGRRLVNSNTLPYSICKKDQLKRSHFND